MNSQGTNGKSVKTSRGPAYQKAKALTAKQEEFIALIRKGYSPESAGYAVWKNTGYNRERRWKKSELLMARLKQAQEEFAEESKISRTDVLEGFLTAINHAQLQGDANAQIKGWEQIAKMHGYYEPEKKIIEHNVHIEQRHLEEMTDAELIAHAGSGPITLAESEFEVVDVEVSHQH